MSYEAKDNTGNLFRIEEPKSEKHPPYEGEFKVICPHCGGDAKGWVKAWVRATKTGSKFFSLAFKFRTQQRDAA